MSNTLKNIPPIPEPTSSSESMRSTMLATKEAVEVIAGQRGNSPFVTWDDLVRLGITTLQDVPRGKV